MGALNLNVKRRAALFLVSQSITLFGSTLVQMAIVWYATIATGSGTWVAAFSICSYLPQFAVSFIGGVWADRFPRRLLIAGADLGIAGVTLIMILFMPMLSEAHALLAALLVLSVVRSVGAGVQTPAVNATVPLLVPADSRMRFNGINVAVQSAVQFAAPAAAGAVLAAGTLRSTLWLDVATAALGVALLLRVPLPAAAKGPASEPVWRSLRDGVSYAMRERSVGCLLAVYGAFVFFCVPGGFLAGLHVSRVFGDSYGHLTATELAGFAGMTAGGLLMGLWGGFAQKERTLLAGLTAFASLSILMAFVARFDVYLVLMALYGVALTTVQTTVSTLLQERSAPAMQGRVFGLTGAVYSGCMPLGMAVFGLLADRLPLRWLMAASGAALLLQVGMAAFGRPRRRA